MNANILKCGQIINYEGQSYMILGFSGKTLYRKNPKSQHKLLTFPEKIHLNQILKDIIVVDYTKVVDLSVYEIPRY